MGTPSLQTESDVGYNLQTSRPPTSSSATLTFGRWMSVRGKDQNIEQNQQSGLIAA